MIILWLYMAFSYLYVVGHVWGEWPELDEEQKKGAFIGCVFFPIILPLMCGFKKGTENNKP